MPWTFLTARPYYWNDGRVQQLNDKGIPIEGQVIPFGYDSLKTYLYDLKRIYALDHRNNKIEIKEESK